MKRLSHRIHFAVQKLSKAEGVMQKARDMAKYNKAVLAFDAADEELKALYAEVDKLEGIEQ